MQRTTTRGRCCLFRYEMQLYLPENWVQMLHTCSPKTGEQHLIKPWEHGRVRGSICTWKVNEDSFYYSWSQVTSALVPPQGATFAVGRRCLTSHHLVMGKTHSLWSAPDHLLPRAGQRGSHCKQLCYLFNSTPRLGAKLFCRRLQWIVWLISRQTFV